MYIVYQFLNTDTGKCYIGVTKHGINRRWQQHVNNAKSNRVPNSYFYKALRTYGYSIWEKRKLGEYQTSEEAYSAELFYIKTHDAFGDNGYNLTVGGDGGKGHIVSKETKDLIRSIRVGSKSSETAKQRISKSLLGNARRKGKSFSDEDIKKISGINNHGFRPWFIQHINGKIEKLYHITKSQWAKNNKISKGSIMRRFQDKYINKYGVTKNSFWFEKACGLLPTEAGIPILEATRKGSM